MTDAQPSNSAKPRREIYVDLPLAPTQWARLYYRQPFTPYEWDRLVELLKIFRGCLVEEEEDSSSLESNGSDSSISAENGTGR